jgi:hypothetical protein
VKAALQAVQALESTRCARGFDTAKKFLPDGLTLIANFRFLGRGDQCFVSQVQARTYANMFGLLRLTGAAPERQALFLRLDTMMAVCMPAGYRFVPDPEVVAGVLHRRSAWSVHALTCLVDLFAQAHYRQSLQPDAALDPLWQEVFQFHLKEESRYVAADELEWRGEDAKLDGEARDRAVGDLITLIGMLDGILQAQAGADAGYISRAGYRLLNAGEAARVSAGLLHAYRWQYILSGVQVPHFSALLGGMLNPEQYGRVAAALVPLFDAAAIPQLRA